MKKLLLICTVIFSALAVSADLPPGSILLEAESFKINGGWQVKPHFPSWYGDTPSGGKFLAGHSAKPGVAVKEVALAGAGKYKLHLRYLDVKAYPAPFTLAVKCGGKTIAEKKLNEVSRRATAEGAKKYGSNFAKFMWYDIEFEVPEAGTIEIVITKLPGGKLTPQGTRHLDLFVLTQDLKFKPDILEIYPLYMQVRMLPEQPRPVAIHVFGRLSRSPYYPPHMNINKKGVFIGAYAGLENMKKDWLAAGDVSPWIKISKYLTFNGNDRISIDARQSYRGAEAEAAFEVVFSRTPDDKNIIKRFRRSGKGNGMLVTINLNKQTVVSDLEASEKNLAAANATTPVPGGKLPVKFPFITGMRVNPGMVDPRIVENEKIVLEKLGINSVVGQFVYADMAAANFPGYILTAFSFGLKDKCFNRPKLKEIRELMQEQNRTVSRLKRLPYFVNLMDEPDFPADHVVKCKECPKAFAEYLKANNAGVSGALTLDKKQGALYYWTVRYRNNLVTRFFAAITAELAKINPQLRTMANFAPDVTGGNSISRGCDWFEIYNSGALTHGWHEDWANLSGTYQCVGFQNAVMRAACRKSGIPYGIYNILCRHPWEVEAKGFSAIGYGNSLMHFFNYGPHYAIASDTNSQRPEIYQAIKNITCATGAVEDILVSARPVPGDIAMLLSNTSDIWNMKTDGIYGKERVYLYMLLRHCNYSTDVLSENDLASQLDKYRTLVVVDSHIRRSLLPVLTEWVKRGNTLYLGANALMYDENNQPLNLDIPRQKFQRVHAKIGRGQDGFVAFSKKNKKFRKMTIVGGQQMPLGSVVNYGRGRVICSGFFPGLSYMHESVKANKQIYSVRKYPETHRKYIASLNFALTDRPRVICSDYLVEAHYLKGKNKSLIVLANWSGEKRHVKVQFNGKVYQTEVGAGGFIEVNN